MLNKKKFGRTLDIGNITEGIETAPFARVQLCENENQTVEMFVVQPGFVQEGLKILLCMIVWWGLSTVATYFLTAWT